MLVIFAHGQESGPWGFKIKRMAPLAKLHGCQVESIDYRDCKDPELRVERLLQRDFGCAVIAANVLIKNAWHLRARRSPNV